MARKRIHSSEYLKILNRNAGVCCVCKTRGIGVNLHHIDHNATNNNAANLAVLCVKEHDAHHRPTQYPAFNHLDLEAASIRQRKNEWEEFVAEAQKPQPNIVAVINAYGSVDEIHSMRLLFQWTTGKVVLERCYHQLDRPMPQWIDSIFDEIAWLGSGIKLAVVDAPLGVDYCSCCQNSLSNTIDEDIAQWITRL